MVWCGLQRGHSKAETQVPPPADLSLQLLPPLPFWFPSAMACPVSRPRPHRGLSEPTSARWTTMVMASLEHHRRKNKYIVCSPHFVILLPEVFSAMCASAKFLSASDKFKCSVCVCVCRVSRRIWPNPHLRCGGTGAIRISGAGSLSQRSGHARAILQLLAVRFGVHRSRASRSTLGMPSFAVLALPRRPGPRLQRYRGLGGVGRLCILRSSVAQLALTRLQRLAVGFALAPLQALSLCWDSTALPGCRSGFSSRSDGSRVWERMKSVLQDSGC